MNTLKHFLLTSSTIAILAIPTFASASNCPPTNTVGADWHCISADSSKCNNGQGTFVGASFFNYEGGYRYMCSYSSSPDSMLVSNSIFPEPTEDNVLKGGWEWVSRVPTEHRIVCDSTSSKNCPIPAFDPAS